MYPANKTITYSTQLMTLRQHMWQQSVRVSSEAEGVFDYESLFRLIIERTDLNPYEAGNLVGDELRAVYKGICDAVVQGIQIAKLSEGFDDGMPSDPSDRQ